MGEGRWGSRDKEKKAGDPKRPEAKWLQLMYKIKKSFSLLALVCGTLSLWRPVRRHLCFVLSPGVAPILRYSSFASFSKQNLGFLSRR